MSEQEVFHAADLGFEPGEVRHGELAPGEGLSGGIAAGVLRDESGGQRHPPARQRLVLMRVAAMQAFVTHGLRQFAPEPFPGRRARARVVIPAQAGARAVLALKVPVVGLRLVTLEAAEMQEVLIAGQVGAVHVIDAVGVIPAGLAFGVGFRVVNKLGEAAVRFLEPAGDPLGGLPHFRAHLVLDRFALEIARIVRAFEPHEHMNKADKGGFFMVPVLGVKLVNSREFFDERHEAFLGVFAGFLVVGLKPLGRAGIVGDQPEQPEFADEGFETLHAGHADDVAHDGIAQGMEGRAQEWDGGDVEPAGDGVGGGELALGGGPVVNLARVGRLAGIGPGLSQAIFQ